MKIKIKSFRNNVSFAAIIIYFLITLVRYFKDAIFHSNTVAALVLLFTAFIFFFETWRERDGKILLNQYDKAWLLILIFMLLHRDWGYDWFRTLMCAIGIVAYLCIGKRIYYVKYGMTLCILFAILTATVSWYEIINYDGYIRILSKLYLLEEVDSIVRFYRQGMMSGLTSHYSSNTFYMVSAIICIISDNWASNISKVKKGRIIKWILVGYLLVTALMVGKRGHLVFLFATLFLTYFTLQINSSKKIKQSIASVIIIIITFPIILEKVPQVSNFFSRLFANSGDILNGRGDLYKNALDMFLRSPLIGQGYGSFSVLMNYENPGVHNDYLQFLCEWGVVGFAICLVAYGGCLYITYMHYRKICSNEYSFEDRRLLLWSIMIQIFVAMYSLTGIPHYDFEVYMLFCMACAVPKNITPLFSKYKKV